MGGNMKITKSGEPYIIKSNKWQNAPRKGPVYAIKSRKRNEIVQKEKDK